jgi:type IV pilus assembly protein PilC
MASRNDSLEPMGLPAQKKRAAGKKKAASKKGAAAKKKTAAKKAPARKKRVSATNVDIPTLEVEIEEPTAGRSTTVSEGLPTVSSVQNAIVTGATRSVRSKDVTVFIRQLIMMLESGTPIVKALKSLSTRGTSKGIRNLVTGITDYVEAGNPLWQAFSREGRHFPPVFVNLIKAGEASGTLTTVLRRLVAFRDEKERLQKQVQIALIYPAVLVAVSFTVIVLLSRFVIPEFRKLFSDLGVELTPFPTFVMGVADFIAGSWWVVVVIIAGIWALYNYWWLRNPLLRIQSDRAKLKIPIIGPITMGTVMADFNRTFSMLLRSGVSMMATLDLCRSSVNNRAFAESIQDMRDSVERGEGMEAPLRSAESQGLMPGVVVDMLMTGEESGSIDTIADQIADSYEEEVGLSVDALKESLQPIMVVTLGIIIGTLVIAMFMPLVDLIERISNTGM